MFGGVINIGYGEKMVFSLDDIFRIDVDRDVDFI